jgi:deglycase
MSERLSGKRIAFLATDMVERAELVGPWTGLAAEGAELELVSPQQVKIQLFEHYDKADTFPVDRALDEASPDDYDALVLPGGVGNPDALRLVPAAVAFVRSFFDAGKPVGAICHAPWLLIEAGVVRGRTLTSWPSLTTDLENAGAARIDQPVMVDGLLVTSRKPDDIPAFNDKLIEVFSR